MALFQFVTIKSTEVREIEMGKKIVQAVATGENEAAGSATVYAAHGLVSRPVGKTRALRVSLGKLNFVIAAFNSWIDPPENPGETKLYSTDADGEEKATVLLDKNGDVTINGGEDFAVRFSELETAFNQLKADHDDFISNIFNAHVHSGVTSGSGSSGTTPTPGLPSTADISGAKVEEVRIP